MKFYLDPLNWNIRNKWCSFNGIDFREPYSGGHSKTRLYTSDLGTPGGRSTLLTRGDTQLSLSPEGVQSFSRDCRCFVDTHSEFQLEANGSTLRMLDDAKICWETDVARNSYGIRAGFSLDLFGHLQFDATKLGIIRKQLSILDMCIVRSTAAKRTVIALVLDDGRLLYLDLHGQQIGCSRLLRGNLKQANIALAGENAADGRDPKFLISVKCNWYKSKWYKRREHYEELVILVPLFGKPMDRQILEPVVGHTNSPSIFLGESGRNLVRIQNQHLSSVPIGQLADVERFPEVSLALDLTDQQDSLLLTADTSASKVCCFSSTGTQLWEAGLPVSSVESYSLSAALSPRAYQGEPVVAIGFMTANWVSEIDTYLSQRHFRVYTLDGVLVASHDSKPQGNIGISLGSLDCDEPDLILCCLENDQTLNLVSTEELGIVVYELDLADE